MDNVVAFFMPPLHNHTVGLSVKADYYQDIIDGHHDIDFFEAHIENFMMGGHHLRYLKQIRAHYSVSLHGVALSLGSQTAPTAEALQDRKKIIDIIQPAIISEHAACTFGDQHFNDLLPISLNSNTVQRLVRNIDITQSYFKRQILLENLSSYLAFDDDDMSEADFLNAVAKHSGCGLLLDVNNIYIQEFNLKRSAQHFINVINPDYVQQYHVAGGEYNADYNMIIDTHGTDIPNEVMALYQKTLYKIGARPTLYERDNNIPPFTTLCQTADIIRKSHIPQENSSLC
ncbi:MAG: hypothetical protein ACJARD_000793 [Alphaproteobacteria bacterium]|jgi:uncharacterized protein (UPF0276 family)